MTNRFPLAGAVLLALVLPAVADPRAAALELYRTAIAAELAFANAYPFDREKMRAARDRLDAVRSAEVGTFLDCAMAADTLAGALAAAATSSPGKPVPLRDAYAWRGKCERGLRLQPARRPLEAALRLYARP